MSKRPSNRDSEAAAAERFFSHMKDTKPPKKNGLHDKSVDAVEGKDLVKK
jgi:hypothetical protein